MALDIPSSVPATSKGFFSTAGGIAISAIAVFALAYAAAKGWGKGKA